MSIFNDKTLKGVAEAVSKVMQQEELKGNQHKIDANKNGKIDAHDFKMLRGKKDMKKEEAELDEAFPTVADAKKRMDAGKTTSGSMTKTKTGLVHKRDYKDDDSAEDTQKKTAGYGARQNFKRSTRVNEAASFTEMLEMYNEYGIKVLASIKTQEEKIGDQTFDVLDADKFNGFVETTVEEEATNDEFTKELKDQEASFLGKKKQPKLTTGKTTGVKEMPESVELDEGMKQNLRKYVPGYAKRELDKKMDAQAYEKGDSTKKTVDKDVNFGRYKKIADKLKKEEVELEERELSKDEANKKEDYVKGMKKGLSGFKDRYGDRAKSVMYATATSMAKKKA